ncbi:hypothetical protein IBL25_26250, partial [Roseomonas ludipueritiae]|nr:hypothetical protein [Pseudoroseomonas ludipueritiae]
LRSIAAPHQAACHFAEALPPFTALAAAGVPAPALAARIAAYRRARDQDRGAASERPLPCA